MRLRAGHVVAQRVDAAAKALHSPGRASTGCSSVQYSARFSARPDGFALPRREGPPACGRRCATDVSEQLGEVFLEVQLWWRKRASHRARQVGRPLDFNLLSRGFVARKKERQGHPG